MKEEKPDSEMLLKIAETQMPYGKYKGRQLKKVGLGV